MAYASSTPSLGFPKITAVDDSAKVALGTIIRAVDPTYGEGEFIYLKGASGIDAGKGVVYDAAFQAAVASIALNVPRPVAIAMASVVADKYGWFQISGQAVVDKAAATSFAAGAALGITSGLAVAAASALLVQNAAVAVVASAKSDVTSVRVMINRPGGPVSD